jgi:quercetin dioxygenase-like cupin family protein
MKVYEWPKIPSEEMRPGIVRRGFATPEVLLVLHESQPGAEVSAHRHPFEQVVYVLEGEVVFVVDGTRHRTPPGSVFCIPPDALHHMEVLGNQTARTLAIFAPPRPDYLHLTAYQAD